MNIRTIAGIALSLLLPTRAYAQEPDAAPPARKDRPSVTLGSLEPGFRTGIGFAAGGAGNFANGTKKSMGDLVSLRVPLWIDLNYRLSLGQTLGVYGQFGLGGDGDACLEDCNWADLRIGLQSQWQFGDTESTRPWFGVGLGYQWLTVRNTEIMAVDDNGDFIDLTGLSEQEIADAGPFGIQRTEGMHGPEVLLQGGLDFQVDQGLAIGPYISGTLSTFLANSQTCTGSPPGFESELCPSFPTESSALHVWLGVGLRGSYAP